MTQPDLTRMPDGAVYSATRCHYTWRTGDSETQCMGTFAVHTCAESNGHTADHRCVCFHEPRRWSREVEATDA